MTFAARLLDASSDALFALAPDGAIRAWNARAEELFGPQDPELLGRRVDELVEVLEADGGLAAVLDEARVTGSALWNAKVRRRDGSEHDLEAVLWNVDAGWLAMSARDVSERMRLTRELLDKRWALEAEARRLAGQLVERERMAAIGELAAAIGHDLRNPLSTIRNALHFVARRLEGVDVKDPRVAQFIEIAENELGACEQTIAGLIDFARDQPLARTHASTAVLLRDALAQIQVPSHVTIDTEMPADLPHVDVDAGLLRRAFGHLLQNACEAIPVDREGRVAVSARASEAEIVVEIADTGHGMTPETRARLFDPLFTTKARGTGLGLAVVAKIVARHGGRVAVASEPGVGSRFTVHLPR